MKKALLAVIVALAAISPAVFISGPAEAACVIRGEVFPMTAGANVGGTTHDAKGYMNYRACGTYADIIDVSYQVYPGNGDCGFVNDEFGGVRKIQEYRFNANAIGSWNPAMTTWKCDPGRQSYVVWKDAPGVIRVRPGDPANERCLAFDFTIIVVGDFDRHRSSNSKCIDF